MPTQQTPLLNPAALEVLLCRLAGIATEMGEVLRRTAFSPNIKERADCSSALFTATGELLAQAEHIPVHLGSMPASVSSVIAAFANTCKPGDQFIVNDPFAGGTHLNDVTLVAPCFADPAPNPNTNPATTTTTKTKRTRTRELLGWVANRAHHADLGGSAPGSMPADAVEIFQEGLRIPPLKFTDEIAAVIMSNSRTPYERRGDIDAQLGANICGVDRLKTLCENLAEQLAPPPQPPLSEQTEIQTQTRTRAEIETETRAQDETEIQTETQTQTRTQEEIETETQTQTQSTPPPHTAAFNEILNYGENLMRANLSDLPAGTWSFTDVLDSFGPEPSQQQPTRVQVAVTITPAITPTTQPATQTPTPTTPPQITFDFTGTDPQVPGCVNAVRAVTESCVAFSLRSVIDPTSSANGGSLRPVAIITQPGSVVDATPPAAVGAGNVELSQRITDVCLGALAQIAPDKVPAASAGTMNNILIGGQPQPPQPATNSPQPTPPPTQPTQPTPDHTWVYYETVAAGQGARPTKPGMNGVHTAMTNTQNTPIEALERAFPLRVKCLKLRRNSGGNGQHRGGEGIQRDLEILAPAVVSLITERRRSRPWGLAGGQPGQPGENWLIPHADPSRPIALPDKITIRTQPGDIVRMLTPGGGGWGAPLPNQPDQPN